ncbi:MAG: diacylglycerol kinase family protein [Pirellulaceae bacterium]
MSSRPTSSEPRLVLIARNPTAGRGSSSTRIADLAKCLETCSFDVMVESDLTQITRIAREVKSAGNLKAIVCAGGDGTIRLIANHLGTEFDYAVFPLGTENLLAKHFRISGDVNSFCQMIQAGIRQRIDAGRANDQLFLIMVSCGFDAEVVDKLHRSRVGHIRHSSYFAPVIQTIFNYRFPQLQITVDGQQLAAARWAFVFNLPRYAMNLALAPMARGNDGLLDLKTFHRGNFLNGLLNFFSVLLRRDQKWKLSQHTTGQTIEITSESPVAYQIDGDLGGHLPVKIEILPAYLSLFTPAPLK